MPSTNNYNQKIKTTEHQNHFHPNYRASGETVNPAPIEKMTTAYRAAHHFAQKKEITIVNATRGGHLEVFPRFNLDKLY